MNDIDIRLCQIPHKCCGRTEKGADCYGWLLLYFKLKLGIDIYPFDELGGDDDESNSLSLVQNAHEEWVHIDVGDIQVHDVLLLNNGDLPSHVSVVIDKYRTQHMTEKGVLVTKISLIKKQIHSAYRHRSLL
jgi:hypothetical protein